MQQDKDPDATVIIRNAGRATPPASTTPMPPGFGNRRLFVMGAAALIAAAGLGGLVAVRGMHRAPAILLPMAEELPILQAQATELRAWRFAGAPRVLVLVFPSLHAQARALNRAAVFLELLGASREHVPDDAALMAEIARAHMTYDGFYYGHDYRASDLRRMWHLADAQGVKLNPEEQQLRALVEGASRAPEGLGAVISMPPPGDGLQDPAGRAAILRHELAHGLYFTDPAYASAVDVFWRVRMTAQQRDAFTHFLGGQGYDTANDELMRNEMQAYLMHTPDARFFSAAAIGLSSDELTALRTDFYVRMPPSWLKARSRV